MVQPQVLNYSHLLHCHQRALFKALDLVMSLSLEEPMLPLMSKSLYYMLILVKMLIFLNKKKRTSNWLKQGGNDSNKDSEME